jgi:hypothetical protein
MKQRFPIILAFIWAFIAIEAAFYLNLFFHWPTVDWRDLDALNNRPAFAICLVACLAVCYSEGTDWSTRFFLWIPTGSVLLFVFLPSEKLWFSVIENAAYPDRIKYAGGQHIYTALLFYPVFMFGHRLYEKKNNK